MEDDQYISLSYDIFIRNRQIYENFEIKRSLLELLISFFFS